MLNRSCLLRNRYDGLGKDIYPEITHIYYLLHLHDIYSLWKQTLLSK